jgi:Hint domain
MAKTVYETSPTSPSYSLTETAHFFGLGESTYTLSITYPAGDGTDITVSSIPSANVLTEKSGGVLTTFGSSWNGGATYVIPPTISGTIDITTALRSGTDRFYVGGKATLNSFVDKLTGYVVQVDGGSLTLGACGCDTLNGLTVSLDNNATLSTGQTPLSALRGMTIDFGANGGTFMVDSSCGPADLQGITINGFVASSDKIEFTNLSSAFSHYSIADNGNSAQTVTLYGADDKVLGSFTVMGTTLTNASLTATVNGGTVTFADPSTDAACFLAGTHIRTPVGEVSVEMLQAGDLILTEDGRAVPVRWVGIRQISSSGANAAHSMPICVQEGALADNVPSRDLYVSPDHAMYLDGMLVPAQYLVNGVNIHQSQGMGTITYYHVETDPHEIIIAENAATESYLDTGNRTSFTKSAIVSLFPAEEPKSWEDACAPLLLSGPELAAIQARLAARACPRAVLGQVA